jgi:hypothetical protein
VKRSAAELPRRRKGDVVKVRVARRLRRETALTLPRIAELLHMGAPTHVAHLSVPRRSKECALGSRTAVRDKDAVCLWSRTSFPVTVPSFEKRIERLADCAREMRPRN